MKRRVSKKDFIKNELKIDDSFGRVFTFIDFANVNNWFKDDNQSWDNRPLKKGERLGADVKGIKKLSDSYSQRTLIYFGQDPNSRKSLGFTI